MNIHAINTGTMVVKERYAAAVGRSRLARLTNALLDSKFRRVPVYTWAIEHPEGTIVIDTGLAASMRDYSYFPALQRPFWTSQYRFDVTEAQEIGPQLWQRGIDPEGVRWLVMTHSHFDHTGGLRFFRNAEVVFTRKDYDDTMTFRSARFAFPIHWPSWLNVRKIDFTGAPLGPFDRSFPLTEAGDVVLVPTPGHTMGHMSVIMPNQGITYFFAGDASFDQQGLLNDVLDAPAFNSKVTLETRRKIREYARQTPLVYLTTHDPQTERRLHEQETVGNVPISMPEGATL